MNRLSDALLGQSRVMMPSVMLPAGDTGMTQKEIALSWLDANPNVTGLSQRAMAGYAGVSLATMQRAMADRKAKKQSTIAVQEKLF
jgi:hypothetical protein